MTKNTRYQPLSLDEHGSLPTTFHTIRNNRIARAFTFIFTIIFLTALITHHHDVKTMSTRQQKHLPQQQSPPHPPSTLITINEQEEGEYPLEPINNPKTSTEPWPRSAWLMSFPNSGTTYTNFLFMGITNTTAAANYGQECDTDETGHNVPIHPHYTNGPFWKDLNMQRPTSGYVLVKTHCGGRCSWCPADKFVETFRSFKMRCSQVDKVMGLDENGKKRVRESVLYDPDPIIFKAVHLIRDPIDNLVARLHHSRKKNGDEYANKYPDTPDGFRKWCDDKDEQFMKKDTASRFFDPIIMDMKRKVTCANELFKYVQWHNLAFATTQGMGIPTHVLHYENFTTNFDGTVDELVDFLDVERKGDAPEFYVGKVYRDYYPKENLDYAIRYMRELSTQKTWSQVKHYVLDA